MKKGYKKYKRVKWRKPGMKSINDENKLCGVYMQPRSLLAQEETLKRAKWGSWAEDIHAEGTTWTKLVRHKSLSMDQTKMENHLSQGWAWVRLCPGLGTQKSGRPRFFSPLWAQSERGNENMYVPFIPKSCCRTEVLGHHESPFSATDEDEASHKANSSIQRGLRVQMGHLECILDQHQMSCPRQSHLQKAAACWSVISGAQHKCPPGDQASGRGRALCSVQFCPESFSRRKAKETPLAC